MVPTLLGCCEDWMCVSICGAEHGAWLTGLSRGYLHSMVMVIIPLLASFGFHRAEGAIPVWFCCLYPGRRAELSQDHQNLSLTSGFFQGFPSSCMQLGS